jgi:SAM-dependent methyltransferase
MSPGHAGAHAGGEPVQQGLGAWLRGLIGVSGVATVQGVRYAPLTWRDSLRSARAGGVTNLLVTFPDGSRLRLRTGPDRRFSDLTPPTLADHPTVMLERCAPWIRPGWRTLVLGAADGALTAGLAALVGPSGSVIGLEADPQFVAYARRRHPLSNAGHERGGPEDLAAEPDGAFEALLIAPTQPALKLADLRRLVAPGGHLIAAGLHADALLRAQTQLEAEGWSQIIDLGDGHDDLDPGEAGHSAPAPASGLNAAPDAQSLRLAVALVPNGA